MPDTQLTHAVKTFNTRRMYVAGFTDRTRYHFSSDGTLVCRPDTGAWQGKVTWTGKPPYYYAIQFKGDGISPTPCKIMVRALEPKALPDPKEFDDQAVIVAIYDVNKYGIGPMAVTLIRDGGQWAVMGVGDPDEVWRAIDGRPLLAWHRLESLLY